MYRRFGKRVFDVTASVLGLVILSPLLIVLAVLIRVKLGSPVIFKQTRPGLHGKLFTMYKFRSMTDERDENGTLLPDTERLTPFGKALRATSLDELLELWNILRADMSFVGPRPLAVQYLQHYTEEENRRHEVLPGLTGLAQINGRNFLDWDSRLALDVQYVDELSLMLDMRIAVKTVAAVLKQKDVAVRHVDGIEDFDTERIAKQKIHIKGDAVLD